MLSGTIVSVALLLLNALIAFIRSAFVNSHHAKLRAMIESGEKRAKLTVRVAEDARRLLLTFGIGLSISRLAVIGVALFVYSLPLHDLGVVPLVSVGGILLSAGILMGFTEFLVDNLAMRNPEQWALRLSPVAYVIGLRSSRVACWLWIIPQLYAENSSGAK